MLQAITRVVLILAGAVSGYVVTRSVDWQVPLSGLSPTYVIFLFVILGAAIGYVFGGIIGRELTAAWVRTEARIAASSAADVVLGSVGLIAGLLVALLVSQPLRLLQPVGFAVAAMTVTSIVAAYLGVSVALTRRREFVQLFPALAPAGSEESASRMVVLDTSAVIDARLFDLCRLGWVDGDRRVPRFVLAELQTLADSADDERRSRGRRGLDLLATLPDSEALTVVEVDYPELAGVDDKLMKLSADTGALLVTVDYNLTKVARVRGIEVLNLNEAAAALRPNYLPGDPIRLRIAKAGKEPRQGVGHLEDGTMVVVQEGRALIGSEADVEVTSVLQTSAGRMIFARVPDQGSNRSGRP